MMKYIKLFMLMAVVSLAAACSDDTDYNSNGDVTIGFESPTVTAKESSGYINVPIVVGGERNGNVKVVVKAEETGENPAKEDANYLITTKTLNLKADTLKSNTVNVEIKIVDDDELNENRTFKLSIVAVDGATLEGNATTDVTIRDNESLIYEQFFGTWTLTATLYDGTTLSTDVTISGTTDEDDPAYDNILQIDAPAMLNVSVDLDLSWKLYYDFDKESKEGVFGILADAQTAVASYGNVYEWTWALLKGDQLYTGYLEAPWNLDENNKIPTRIVFDDSFALAFYQTLYQAQIGLWETLDNIVLTKK